MAGTQQTAAPYLAQFEGLKSTLPGAGLAWLGAMREHAIERFAETGFPTPRVEAWKYTNLTRLARTEFVAPGTAAEIGRQALAPSLLADGSSHRMVFVNGVFAPGLSDIGTLPAGVSLAPLADAIESDPAAVEHAIAQETGAEDDALADLNTAMMRDGLVLRLAPGAALEMPVHLIHYTSAQPSPAAVHLRNLVIAGDDSRATVIETYAGTAHGVGWTNAVTDIAVGPGAALHHVRLQREGADIFHIGRARVRVARDGVYSGFTLSVGAALSRNEIVVALADRGAACALAGGALVRDRQHADITTRIDHQAPDTTSRQLFKNVADDRGRAVYQGGVTVQPDAQKVDAAQSSRNLLLSPRARADAKPALRIFADDVKCSHGATFGDLDREALFYLTSRGIAEDAARALLVRAFIGELLDGISDPAAHGLAEAAIGDWLGAVGEAP